MISCNNRKGCLLNIPELLNTLLPLRLGLIIFIEISVPVQLAIISLRSKMVLARIARNGCQQSGGAAGRYAMLGEESTSVSKSHSPRRRL
ncbi:internal alternative NAD(P)H-ubiquinone oxidoreductase A1, mitochondrial-like isoform X1 [Salvia divinorum]|uniref:Internal alternative NAD(P)H-ubiquinone oxidoreductase A1, mitochondrial-like isoform X1 n=1 Tax=Salvia divinorum TaxID=28513 RepID=A0ABD1IHF4_SALDI